MPCTQWKLPGYRNPKAGPDHLHYICDTGEMRFPRNRLLPSLWRFLIACHSGFQARLNENVSRGGSLRRCIRVPTAGLIHAIPIIPQLLFHVSIFVKKYSSFVRKISLFHHAPGGKRRETIGQKAYALVVVDERPICDNPVWHGPKAFIMQS